jgi:quercetin dioxygenase-like cupin family protein
MRIEGVPFSTIDWTKIPPTEHPGETGKAIWQTVEQGNLRVRKVEYSAGYKADHWCSRGHVLHVISGELTTDLQDGRSFVMRAGETYIVAEGSEPHRSRTDVGAMLFIVD